MIWLSIVFCLSAQPSQCMTLDGPDTYDDAIECALDAVPYSVQWIRAHPGWTIDHFNCGPGKPL